MPTPAPMPAHAHTTVHAAKPKVHEHLAAECDLDAELQGSIGLSLIHISIGKPSGSMAITRKIEKTTMPS